MAGVFLGNAQGVFLLTVTLDPAIVGANLTAEQTFTVPGLIPGDFVIVSPPGALNAGLGVVGARVSAANTLAIRFSNNTGSGINAAAGEYTLAVIRPESMPARSGVAF